MVLSRDGPIIRHTGAVFEGEAGRKYAGAVKKIVDACKAGLDDVVDGGVRLGFTHFYDSHSQRREDFLLNRMS